MSLLVWLPLNGSLENKGISPATFSLVTTGGGVGTSADGKIATNCYRRSTRNTISHITSDINFSLTGDISMACWCKLTDYGTTDSANGIITQHGHLTGGLGITMRYISSNDYRMCINTGTKGDSFPSAERDRTYHTYYGNTNIYNEWHHLCLTYTADKKQIHMYVDGNLDRDPITVAGNNTTARPFRLFDWSTDHSGNASYRPPCYLNDVRLYDHCLSPKEVKSLAQGLVAHYTLDNGSVEPTTNILNGNWPHTNFENADLGTYASFSNQLGTDSIIEVRKFDGQKCLYIKGGSGSNGRCYRSIAVSGDTSYTFSLDLYSTSTTNVYIKCEATGGDYGSNWPTIGSAAYTTPNNWQRLSFTITPQTNPTLYFFIQTPTDNEIYINNIQLEEKDHATPYTESSRTGKIVYDSSGYENHCSTKGGYPTCHKGSPRYTNYYQFKGNTADDVYNTTTQFNYTDNFSWACWVKHNYTGWKATTNPPDASYAFTVGRADYGGYGYGLEEASAGSMRIRFGSQNYTISLNENWHHVAFTKSGTTIKTYVDGVPTERVFIGALPTYSDGNGIGFGCFHYSSSIYPYFGAIADFRLYATALSEEAIKQLYEARQIIDKTGVDYVYNINEINTNVTQVKPNGNQNVNYLSEIIELNDGSHWIQLQHHNNRATTNRFSSSDDFANKFVYHNDECWSAFHLIEKLPRPTNSIYEFMAFEELGVNCDKFALYRWTQNKSPLQATHNEMWSSANYSYNDNYDIPANRGGLYRYHGNSSVSGSTFLRIANGTEGNWFGAFGASGTHSSGGVDGIPSFTGATAGVLDLYMRVDPTALKYREFKNGIIMPTTLNEI